MKLSSFTTVAFTACNIIAMLVKRQSSSHLIEDLGRGVVAIRSGADSAFIS
jgi:hypothetical protein|tara:strand:- start:3019 stop:3171 length:153 start_codon:yes stop_codon:yes gene_type:complete